MPTPESQLAHLADQGLLRQLRPLDSATGPSISKNGRTLWNFASNDYLGLASHPAIAAAFHEGLERFGPGAAASRLITGTQPPHVALEEKLAAAKGSSAALTFSSGYAAALGAIPALVGKDDHVLLDKLAHACLIDAARLSGATLRVFPHNDLEKLRRLLVSTRSKSDGRILIVTESVFSMDGDLCPLREIVDLKDEHGALLWLDEAHGFGVLGSTGMGLAEAENLQHRVDFQMGTLGKAAGLAGAYVACSAIWRDLLINRARSFIYSTAPPPALAHAASAAIALITSPEGARLRTSLRQNVEAFGSSLNLPAPRLPSPIVPWILGSNEAALQAAALLEEAGFLVPAIRYPTVPRGTARLRVSLSATHPADAVAALGEKLAAL